MIRPKKIEGIMELSKKLENNPDKIIEMMQHHASEIKELYNNNNKHFAIETGDLIILSIQLLMMEGYSVKTIMET